MKKILFLFLISTPLFAQKFTNEEINQWRSQSKQVTIIRDTWGIPHIYGKTDADAVFGFLYAQCEDDFERVEMNYVTAVGRLAEIEGVSKLYHDLRTRLFYDSVQAVSNYRDSPAWLKRLCDGFAAGVNYYLHTHPQVKPKLLTRFQPWMPFLFSEGSIGGDIESISVSRLRDFYGSSDVVMEKEEVDHNPEPEPRGSNGFAIAPSRSASGNALLLINPHTSFYFRPEVHVNSEEGLNAYGAVTWGQFFVYQGFNQYCGWMHTSGQADVMDEYLETIVKRNDSLSSSQADVMDEYLETIEKRNDSLYYKYGTEYRALTSKKIKLAYKDGDKKSFKEFTALYTHHGPVVAKSKDYWVTLAMMVEPLKALTQSYQRTKSKRLEDYKKTMELKANSSNNTVFADSEGNIAYWHGDFIPKRNTSYDWTKPLDGSIVATDWQGLHEVSEIVHSYNPASGWIQNCNSTPFTLAGEFSPDKSKFPSYMAPDAQNARGINAERVLKRESAFTIDKLIAAANDPYLSGFEELIPTLVAAYKSSDNPTLRTKLKEPIALLSNWDKSYGIKSVATTLAIYWGQELRKQISSRIPPASDQLSIIKLMETRSSDVEKLDALEKILDELQLDFGTWVVAGCSMG